MNALSNTLQVYQSFSGVLLLAAFSKLSGELYEWYGTLIEPWPTMTWLCVAIQLYGIEQ